MREFLVVLKLSLVKTGFLKGACHFKKETQPEDGILWKKNYSSGTTWYDNKRNIKILTNIRQHSFV